MSDTNRVKSETGLSVNLELRGATPNETMAFLRKMPRGGEATIKSADIPEGMAPHFHIQVAGLSTLRASQMLEHLIEHTRLVADNENWWELPNGRLVFVPSESA